MGPRHASTSPSLNYTLTMATESDLDDETREDLLEDQPGDIEIGDPYSSFGWLELIDGKVTPQQTWLSQKTQIAECKAYLVRRHEIADSFWDGMTDLGPQMAKLAFELFDRYGCLQPKFKNHPLRRGCGVWNSELDDGDILIIGDIRVSRSQRRRGIGSKLVHAILELTEKKSRSFFAMTSPEVFIHGIDREEFQHGANNELLIRDALRFWRIFGFRRIGSSRWLGFTPDQNHPSHAIAPEQDFDLPSFSRQPLTPEMASLAKDLSMIDDKACLTRLKSIYNGIPSNDPRWQARNDNGDTFLHLVSSSSKPQSTRWLMHSNPVLCHALNQYGSTPLLALEEQMERKRTYKYLFLRREHMSDLFSGFDPATISCLALLRGLEAEQLSAAEISRLKYGCTCGSCLGGFLSPRMREILLSAAETTYESISFDSNRDDDAERWCDENEDVFRYLPEYILESFRVNKGMIIGFCELWKHLASCLRENKLPTEANILLLVRNGNGWLRRCHNLFLQNSGTVSSVATMLFWKAMDLEAHHESEKKEFDAAAWDSLPKCRNDREFGFVSGMCGFGRVSRVQEGDVREKRGSVLELKIIC